MKTISFYFILGGGGVLGALKSNPRLPNFQGSMTSSQTCITRGKAKITNSFSYMSSNVIFLGIFRYSGGGGAGYPKEWAQLASQLSPHLHQSTYHIWKQSVQDFSKLSCSQRNVCGRGVTMTKP